MHSPDTTLTGQLVDVHERRIYPAIIHISQGHIVDLIPCKEAPNRYILPGFIDAHVHIESTMLTPYHFGHMVAPHGTVAVVTDPHEIANVLGVNGINYMMQDAALGPIKCFFTIPSCVPATPFDRAGASITAAEVASLAQTGKFVGLSEMMNIPGVLQGDPEVMDKIKTAQAQGLPIDGHAPLLTGGELTQYVEAGITTDHESMTLTEATEKAALGMQILIREGSAARNYAALAPLLATCPEQVMFCTDDSHPDDLCILGHIDKMVRRAVHDGYDLFDVLRAASVHAVEHYKLPVGLLRIGDAADCIVVDSLTDFGILQTYIQGQIQYDRTTGMTQPTLPYKTSLPNNFVHDPISLEDICYAPKAESVPVIDLIRDELVTERGRYTPKLRINGAIQPDVEEDVLKIVYINRYHNTHPQVALVRGFGLQTGAIAASVAHDSHNIIAVGANDTDLLSAINTLITSQGGLALCHGDQSQLLPLPIAGLMSALPGDEVAAAYQRINQAATLLGTPLHAPYMTLSFLSLVVIPQLKIGEEGLFDYTSFSWLKD